MSETTTYGYKPANTSKYLRLSSKGEKAVIRIVSNPFIFLESITDQDTGEIQEVERFAWLVIDKTDETKPRVRGYRASASVFEKIKKLAENPKWGDPTRYDIEVERTEQPGAGYWAVTPQPPIANLSDAEKAMAESFGTTLQELYQVAGDKIIQDVDGRRPNEPEEDADQENASDPFIDE